MLRVGLTGGLGSGKSTVGAMLARHGAYVIQADEIGRQLMEPGEDVYAAIVEGFGPGVVRPDGLLDRPALARMAFGEGRLEDLNAIVHPAVIARQARLAEEIGARDGDAVVVVESALIFETRYGDPGERAAGPGDTSFGRGRGTGGWRGRFDRLVLVTADEERKVARYVARCAGGETLDGEARGRLEAEARQRLEQQIPDAEKAAESDDVLWNNGSLEELGAQVDALWERLRERAQSKKAREI